MKYFEINPFKVFKIKYTQFNLSPLIMCRTMLWELETQSVEVIFKFQSLKLEALALQKLSIIYEQEI
jgi:hypothetical protein